MVRARLQEVNGKKVTGADYAKDFALTDHTGRTALMWSAESRNSQVPAMLKPAVHALFRTDLDLKRSAGEPRVLLERLVVELCARGAGRPSQTGGARRW